MAKLGPKGFLSPEFTEVIEEIRISHKNVISLCEKLNELAHAMLNDIKVDNNDKQQLLVYCLFIRALTTYQGAAILAQRGMVAETTVVIRTLFEVLFRLCAIVKHPEVADVYIKEDLYYRRKAVFKLTELRKLNKEGVVTPDLTEISDEINSEIAADDIKKRSTEWYAKEAGLEGFYYSAYCVCSRTVHVNVRDLESALALDPTGELIGFKYGPDLTALGIPILAAMESMIFILDSVRKLFATIHADKVDTIYQEFKATYSGT